MLLKLQLFCLAMASAIWFSGCSKNSPNATPPLQSPKLPETSPIPLSEHEIRRTQQYENAKAKLENMGFTIPGSDKAGSKFSPPLRKRIYPKVDMVALEKFIQAAEEKLIHIPNETIQTEVRMAKDILNQLNAQYPPEKLADIEKSWRLPIEDLEKTLADEGIVFKSESTAFSSLPAALTYRQLILLNEYYETVAEILDDYAYTEDKNAQWNFTLRQALVFEFATPIWLDLVKARSTILITNLAASGLQLDTPEFFLSAYFPRHHRPSYFRWNMEVWKKATPPLVDNILLKNLELYLAHLDQSRQLFRPELLKATDFEVTFDGQRRPVGAQWGGRSLPKSLPTSYQIKVEEGRSELEFQSRAWKELRAKINEGDKDIILGSVLLSLSKKELEYHSNSVEEELSGYGIEFLKNPENNFTQDKEAQKKYATQLSSKKDKKFPLNHVLLLLAFYSEISDEMIKVLKEWAEPPEALVKEWENKKAFLEEFGLDTLGRQDGSGTLAERLKLKFANLRLKK